MIIVNAHIELNAFVAPLDSSCCLTPRICQHSGGSTALLPISAFLFDKNLVYGPLVVDPCFKTVETFEIAASIEEDELSVTLYH